MLAALSHLLTLDRQNLPVFICLQFHTTLPSVSMKTTLIALLLIAALASQADL